MRNLMGGASPREMEIFLKWNRDAYDAGLRLPDPEEVNGGPDLVMTTSQYDRVRQTVPRLSPFEEKAMCDMLGLTSEDLRLMQRILAS
jgi:hypothetical protein